MSSYETLLADASRLPVTDRIQLIEALWDTLPADRLPPLTDEWIAEIQRRSAEYDSGFSVRGLAEWRNQRRGIRTSPGIVG